eukprot:CAMPEP_0181320030 /NCGR_PEP_ID=MMETSP1101-20121128/17897_1 /TAXON_ID=46948 /ORGANISM="Rhodomonas abbreviata, Strain Caron Lab Isolate" /LENGTH=85 /DNA_ID=CAMNT_0023427689 /DNA_START=209 /DNA_END=466 /DNA_ORIENTATION=-
MSESQDSEPLGIMVPCNLDPGLGPCAACVRASSGKAGIRRAAALSASAGPGPGVHGVEADDDDALGGDAAEDGVAARAQQAHAYA